MSQTTNKTDPHRNKNLFMHTNNISALSLKNQTFIKHFSGFNQAYSFSSPRIIRVIRGKTIKTACQIHIELERRDNLFAPLKSAFGVNHFCLSRTNIEKGDNLIRYFLRNASFILKVR